ncbi:Histone-Lysine N-Methyltransferase ash1l [Podila verticillata]|nr:Histone-Lysine N-Methyltransferase ash1l [Podila verticillata]KFH73015.1 hypothetical protein MVEG_00240 [Podila verticillata NRRL 6337]
MAITITDKVPNSENTMELPAASRLFPCKTLMKQVNCDNRPYPTIPIDVSYGKGLQATQDCPVGTVLEKFEGPVLEYSELGSSDIPYVLNFYDEGQRQWKWMLGLTPAIYANHSCEPNARINLQQEIVAIRLIKAGEEVLFVYNNDTEDQKWDPLWTFDCKCGAKNCQGLINTYRPWEPVPEKSE